MTPVYIRHSADDSVGNYSGNNTLVDTNVAPITLPLTDIVNGNPAKPAISWDGTELSTTATGVNYQWILNNAAIAGATSGFY